MKPKDFPQELKDFELKYTTYGSGASGYKMMRCPEHRFVWFMEYGWVPSLESGYSIDHINRIRDDNRIENLRLAEIYQQSVNTKRPCGKSDFVGVKRNKSGDKWEANLNVRPSYFGKDNRRYIGCYILEEHAAVVYFFTPEDLSFSILNYPNKMDDYLEFCQTQIGFCDSPTANAFRKTRKDGEAKKVVANFLGKSHKDI